MRLGISLWNQLTEKQKCTSESVQTTVLAPLLDILCSCSIKRLYFSSFVIIVFVFQYRTMRILDLKNNLHNAFSSFFISALCITVCIVHK